MWLSIPLEIQQQCFQDLDVSTLKSLRLVSKSISWLATEVLFSTVSVQPREESAEKFKHVAEDATLRFLVRTIVFNTSDDPNAGAFDAPSESADPNFEYEQCLEKMARFDSLREVCLKFARRRKHQVPDTHTSRDVQAAREGDTMGRFGPPRYTPEIYASEDFTTVMGKVRKLHLCIATETDEPCPEDSIEMPGCHEMFNVDLMKHWLTPVKQQLTHLSLYATECPWGFWPFCDLSGTHFPHLQSLSLGNHTIAHEWQIDWILSHADTLKELFLDDCPIICVAKMSSDQVAFHWPDLEPIPVKFRFNIEMYLKEIDLRWHQIFTRFRTGLPHLRHFAIGQGAWHDMQMFEERYELIPRLLWDRYHMFDNEFEPSQWVGGGGALLVRGDTDKKKTRVLELLYGRKNVAFSFPECDEEDYDALTALLELVNSRAFTF